MRINSIQYSHIQRAEQSPTLDDEGMEYVAQVPTGNNLPRACPDELSMVATLSVGGGEAVGGAFYFYANFVSLTLKLS